MAGTRRPAVMPSPTWIRLAKDDYRTPREDVDLFVLRDREEVAVARPRADPGALLPSYAAAAVPVARLARAVVSGPTFQLFTSRGELVRESVVRRRLGEAALADTSLVRAVQHAAIEDATVAMLGTHRASNYFHWWVDSVVRVWLLDQALGLRDVTWLGPVCEAPFHGQSLGLLGIPLTRRPVNSEPLGYTQVWFTPGLAFGAAQALSPMLAHFAGYVQGRLPAPVNARRLYVTRHSARLRRVVNDDSLSEALLRVGFEIADLDPLSVAEQAELFSEAQVIVSAHGAGLTNLLFARPGTGVIELFPRGALQSSCYRHIASLLSQPYAPLESSKSAEGATGLLNDDLVVDIDRVLQLVDQLGRNSD